MTRLNKLNIGCGYDLLEGYINVDINKDYKPDVVADFRKLNPLYVDEVRASHLLEHFDRFETIEILKQWRGWLKKGGKLVLEVPDFEEICKEFSKGNKYWLSRHTFGSHKANWAFHRESWWKEKFEEVLPKVGFKIIKFKKEIRVYPTQSANEDTTISKEFQGNDDISLPNLIVYAEKL